MKSFYRIVSLLFLFCISLQKANAQIAGLYNFSFDTLNNYTPLSGATSIAHGSGMDNQTYSLSMPFSFNLCNTSYTTIFVSSNGYISFGVIDPGTAANPFSLTNNRSFVAPLCADIKSVDTSSDISYQTIGVSPNRQFIVQWTNFRSNTNVNTALNFQGIIHEDNGSIDMRYGICTMTSGTFYPIIGIRGKLTTDIHCRYSSGGNMLNSQKINYASSCNFLTSSNTYNKLNYTFNPPPICTPPGIPTNVNYELNGNYIYTSFTPPTPSADKYLLITSIGPLTSMPVNGTNYNIGAIIGNGQVIDTFATNVVSTYSSSLPSSTYTLTLIAYNDSCYIGPNYNTSSVYSVAVHPFPKAYHWLPTTGSHSFKNPSNWSPTRYSSHTLDSLYFDNGGQSIATESKFYAPGYLNVKNNTTIRLLFPTAVSAPLDGDLSIDTLSKLIFSAHYTASTSSSNFYFSSTYNSSTKIANIKGSLQLDSNFVFSPNGSITTVKGDITINHNSQVNSSTFGSLFFKSFGLYHHHRNAGTLPLASFDTTSTVLLNNITTSAPTIPSYFKPGNFIWHCDSQSSNLTLPRIDSILGNLQVSHTNSRTLALESYYDIHVFGKLMQDSSNVAYNPAGNRRIILYGDILFNTGHFLLGGYFSTIGSMTILKNLYQQSSHQFAQGGSGVFGYVRGSLLFAGNQQQSIDFSGNTNDFDGHYFLNNNAGVNLIDTLIVKQSCFNHIIAGYYTGSGSCFYDSIQSGLKYCNMQSINTSDKEWPLINGPQFVYIESKGNPNNNHIRLHAERTIPARLGLYGGVLVLNQNNLSLKGDLFFDVLGKNNMIAADSSGYFSRSLVNQTYNQVLDIFPIGDVQSGHHYSPFKINHFYTSAKKAFSVRVKAKQHPADTSSVKILRRYFDVIDSMPSQYHNYNFQFGWDVGDIVGVPTFGLKKLNGSTWTDVSSYFNSDSINYRSNNATVLNNQYNTITGTYAAFNISNNIYTWNGSSTIYDNPNSWTPVRTTPMGSDILVFNNGIIDTVLYAVNDAIAQLRVENNTYVKILSNGALFSAANFFITGDNDTSTADLIIAQGSRVDLNNSTITDNLIFSCDGNVLNPVKIEIDGELNTYGLNGNDHAQLNLKNCIGEVGPTGVIGTTVGYQFLYGSLIHLDSISKISFRGKCVVDHRFYTGYWPNFNWQPGSVLYIKGLQQLSGTYVPPVYPRTLYNLTIDCPSLIAKINFTRLPKIIDTFKIISTGTSEISLNSATSTSSYTNEIGVYQQLGGKLKAVSNMPSINSLKIYRDFIQTGGTISNTGTGMLQFNFARQDSSNNVSFFNTEPTGNVEYKISSPLGINLSGGGSLVDTFRINNSCKITVATLNPNPINTTLQIKYAGIKTSLVYEVQGNCTVPLQLFPGTTEPKNLTINVGVFNTVSLPYDIAIADTLRLLSGFLRTQGHNISLGTSGSNPGKLIYNANSGLILDTASFTRWIANMVNTTASQVDFPLYTNTYFTRLFKLYATSSTNAVATPGQVKVAHIDSVGFSSVSGVPTILSRTNGFWKVDTSNGFTIVAPGTMMAEAYANHMLSPYYNNLTHYYLMNQANLLSATGNGSYETYPLNYLRLTGASVTNLTAGNIYIGSTQVMDNNLVYTVASGNWNNPAVWNIGSVPTNIHHVIISDNTVVNVTDYQSVLEANIQEHGILNINTDTLVVRNAIRNYGQINLNNGGLQLYFHGGGGASFLNYGKLLLSSGNLEVNGYIHNLANSSFKQLGGRVLINPIGPFNSSFYSTEGGIHFYSDSVQLTSGTLEILNPSKGSQYSLEVWFNKVITCGNTYKLIIGGSTEPLYNGQTYHYYIQSSSPYTNGKIIFNDIDIICESIYSPPVLPQTHIYIKGDLKVKGFSEYYFANTHLAGDLLVDTFATLQTGSNYGNLFFEDIDSNGILKPASNPQSLSGTGSVASSIGYTLSNLTINNSSSDGVSIYLGNLSVEDKISLKKGKLNMPSGHLQWRNDNHDYLNPPDYNKSWVTGKIRYIPTIYLNNNMSLIPIGNSSHYLPIYINGISNGLSNSGYLECRLINGDHSSITSSQILPSKSVNLHYKLTPSTDFSIGATNIGIGLNWHNSYQDISSNYLNYTMSKFKAGSWTPSNTNLIPSFESIAIQIPVSQLEGEYQIGEGGNQSLITTQPSNDTICQNMTASFTIVSVSGPTLQWQIFTSGVWVNLNASSVYSNVTSSSMYMSSVGVAYSGNQYRCRVVQGSTTEYSSIVTLIVKPSVTPSILLTSITDNPICTLDTSVIFANYYNCGTNPQLTWSLNGSPYVTTSNMIQYYSSASVYTITCTISSNAACASSSSAVSNTLIITKSPTVAPTITLNMLSPNPICYNQFVNVEALTTGFGILPVYSWQVNSTTYSNLTDVYNEIAGLNNFTLKFWVFPSSDACVTPVWYYSNTLSINVLTNNPPTVSIASTPSSNVCSGTLVYFTPTGTNGGTNPTYHWYKNGIMVATAPNYVDSTLVNTDSVWCVMVPSSYCNTLDSATSNKKGINIIPPTIYSVSINVSPNDTLCVGSTATFISTVVNSPTNNYTWYKNNGTPIGSSQNYTSSTLQNNDSIYLIITPTGMTCPATPKDTSNKIVMTFLPITAPTIAISSVNGNSICVGDTVTLISLVTNAGTNPDYQWYLNGAAVGSNNDSLVYNSVINNDVFTCVVNSNYQCSTPDTLISNAITITVNTALAPLITISPQGSDTICAGDLLLFNSNITNGGSAPQYQWYVNGSLSGTSSSFSSNSFNNGDQVSCVLISSFACASPFTDSSNIETVTVFQIITPTVSINVSPSNLITVSGATYTFTATPLNAGSSQTYKWYVNNVLQSGSSNIFISSSLNLGDEVYCVVESDNPCADNSNTKSNIIYMEYPVSTTQIEKSDLIEGYPNPTTDYFNIRGKASNLDESIKLEIQSSDGRKLWESELQLEKLEYNIRLDFRTYADGVYFIKISQGDAANVFKLLKEK